MSNKVKVAVRVRPYTEAEKAIEDAPCIFMQDTVTVLFKGPERRQFTFDYSHWSHDGYLIDSETGYYYKSASDSKYVDQHQVFEDVGMAVLHNALKGYNACIFAYGQTGSGKSHTMVGSESNPGVIPRLCAELFSWTDGSQDPSKEFAIEVSIFEIYNEKLFDLLQENEESEDPQLSVRAVPSGVYIDGLSVFQVDSISELEALMARGNSKRKISATLMNDTSSRAHTIYRLILTQSSIDPRSQTVSERLESEINLVDLAGSERVGETGVTGRQFEEGTKINLSLSNLRNVITALTSNHPYVPYRDSQLTLILQNALGGNSKTAMIATISPAVINYAQTLSTLRYAQQVKFIENSAVVNMETMNPETAKLRHEIQTAKAELQEREMEIQELTFEVESIREKLDKDLNDRSANLPSSRDTASAGSVRVKNSKKRSCACSLF